MLTGVLNWRRCHAVLVHGDLPALLVQRAAVEVALDDAIGTGFCTWGARAWDVNVVRALWCVYVDRGALERTRALFTEPMVMGMDYGHSAGRVPNRGRFGHHVVVVYHSYLRARGVPAHTDSY